MAGGYIGKVLFEDPSKGELSVTLEGLDDNDF